MTMTQTEILESIDQIENVITESEVNVTLAIIDSYQKASRLTHTGLSLTRPNPGQRP